MADDAPWARALCAARLLSIDPGGLGGIVVRARAGPVRDAYVTRLETLPKPQVRLHPATSDDALFGGIDLAASLAAGRRIDRDGMVRHAGTLVLTMAERAPSAMAARLASIDHTPCLLLLDEGATPDETAPAPLSELCAFAVDLNDIAIGAVMNNYADIPKARQRLATIGGTPEILETIATLSIQLGITSLRAPIFTLRAARAHAALVGHDRIDADDLEIAAQLTLAHRATRLPEDAPPPPSPPETEDTPTDESDDDPLGIPDDMILDAVRALLPDDLLERMALRRARQASGSGAGARKRGNRRGRPLPARAGALTSQSRIDISATLAAAAPWQGLRSGPDGRLALRRDDIRLMRFEDRSDRVLIFAVDASGSAAFARLSEAKGAVELLLSRAYATRDQVALIAFRGTGAEVLLPATRSLVQAKRQLAALPGGGGTPLATGLEQALALATQERRRGFSPVIVLLTDGRANVARDGTGNRAQAGEDATRLARAIAGADILSLVIDTGNRPEAALRNLADVMGGSYLPLPRADAERVSNAVSAALDS